jgi:uncharacterized delta-60 repeat protein
MLINFRQGIINAQINNNFLQLVNGNVNINVDVDRVDLAFAYGNHNYLFTEAQQVLSAWNGLPSNQTAYLYWDIDLISGIRTYGFTVVAPSFGGQYPSSPLINQHFFNYTTNKMYVWSGTIWQEKLRVFAGSVQDNAILVANGLGSQVNLYGQVNLGYILFNSQNKPLRITDNTNIFYFVTTEDEIHTQQDLNNAYKIDALLMDGRAIEPIPAFSCITWKGPKQTGVASYVDYQRPCIGIAAESSGVDEVKQFVTKGFLTNYINWNFDVPPSTPLFVGITGQVTTSVPQQYSLQRIGHVVSPNTIFVNIEEIILLESFQTTPTPTPSSSPTPTLTPSPTPSVTPTATPVIPSGFSLYAGGAMSNVGGILGIDSLNADGTLNTAFTNLQVDGYVDYMYQTADTKIYTLGSFTSIGSHYFPTFARLNSDGTFDTTFTAITFNSEPLDMHQTADGKIYLVGNFSEVEGDTTTYTNGLVRLNSDGTLDTSYTPPTFGTFPYLSTLYQTADGKIYIGGTFTTTVDGNNYNSLIRLNADGTLDTSFTNLLLDNDVSKVYQISSGKIYIAGDFTTVGGNSYSNLARLNSDGTVDTTFTAITFNNPVYSVYQTIDNKIYVVGSFTTLNGNTFQNLARLNSDGTVDSTIGNLQLAGQAYNVTQTADGKIYVGGNIVQSVIGTAGVYNMVRLNSDGTYDNTFIDSLKFSGTINNILQISNGTIYVASNGMAQAYNNMVRLFSSGTVDITFTELGLQQTYGEVDALLRSHVDNKIYMGGQFMQVEALNYRSLARLNADGTLDTSYTNYDIIGGVLDLYQTVDDKIYVSGNFNSVGGATYNYLARLNADGTLDTSMVDLALNNIVNSIYQTIDNKIYVGGGFDSSSTVGFNSLNRLNSDGTLDTTFIDVAFPADYSIYYITQTLDGKIYVGGQFSTVGVSTYNHLARLNSDGTLDTTFTDLGLNGNVFAIYQTVDGKIYIGGDFVAGGANTYDYILRLNSDGTLDTTFIGGGISSGIRVLQQSTSGKLLIGRHSAIELYNSDGTFDSDIITSNGNIMALLINN